MLPPHLAALKNRLTLKGYHSRTAVEDSILEELEAVDKDLDRREITESTKANQKYARSNPGVSGPNPGTRCVFCGR